MIEAVSPPTMSHRFGAARRRERVAGDLRPQAAQPQAEPCALEAGVAGDQHPAATPELESIPL